MALRKLVPLLAVATLLTAGGAVVADASVDATLQAEDFNASSGELVGYRLAPNGKALGFYLHTGRTQHLVGRIGNPNLHPPSPCYGLTHAWNASIAKGESAPQRFVLLTRMAQHECTMDIQYDSVTSELYSIAPAP